MLVRHWGELHDAKPVWEVHVAYYYNYIVDIGLYVVNTYVHIHLLMHVLPY